MSTNGRKGNRSSFPAPRGGARRSNTAAPPAVRGVESDPISTSRPRGNEEGIPALGNPPADIVAAAATAARGAAEPEPTAKTPPVVAAPPEPPPPRDILTTLVSRPDSKNPPPIIDDEGAGLSQPAPSVRGLTGAPGAVRRKRGSNLSRAPSPRSGPPSATAEPPKAVEPADAPISSRATVPAPIVEEATKPHVDLPPVSAPPASDLDGGFFDPSSHDPHRDDGSDLDHYDERMAHKNSPEARARREKNWTYIRWTAGFCVTLMALALIRSTTHHGDEVPDPPPVVTVSPHSPNNTPTAAPGETAAAAASPEGTAPSAAASAIPTATTDDLPAAPGAPAASARFAEQTAALGVAAKAQGTDPATAPIPVAVPAEPTESEKKSAVQEKRSCQSFLDQGAFAKAVEAGERSVALDPADGEAWLMLGAAYQSMGKTAEARRSFSSCVAEAKKGPIGECRSMLR